MDERQHRANLRRDPFGWIAKQIAIGPHHIDRIVGRLEDMAGLRDSAPMEMGRAMIRRHQLPEEINMPGGYSMYFFEPNAYDSRALTFATAAHAKPQVLTLPQGGNMWRFPGRSGVVVQTAGIDTYDGSMCHEKGCVARGLWGALGGQRSYDSIIDDMKAWGAHPDDKDGIVSSDIHMYLRQTLGEGGYEQLIIPGTENGGLGRRYDPRADLDNILAGYDLLSDQRASGILQIRSKNLLTDQVGGGHAIGYFQGDQIVHHPLAPYGAHNTAWIDDIIKINEGNRTIQ